MVQIDKRLLWHPRKENKFVVGEHSQIVLYEWASEYPEIRHVTSQHDLHSMKCFAWSPDPSFDDLIAVGLSTGKVDLIRLEASRQSHRKNTLSSGPCATLPIRIPRACNAVDFSSANPNYLAVGLDRVRGDSGLIIWDLVNVVPGLRFPHFELNENIDNLEHRPIPQIPRIDSHTRNDQRTIQQHATAEAVCSLSFLPSSAHLLLANISSRYLRLFDLRAPSIPPLNSAAKLQSMAVDPFDFHSIATCWDNTVTIWDIRKFLQPVMTFSERDALADGAKIKQGPGYTKLEFSNTRRGIIATLEKESTYVRFWDLSKSTVSALEGSAVGGSSDGETTKNSRETNRGARRSWANLPWSGGSEKERLHFASREADITASLELQSQQALVLSDTHRTKYFSRPLASFALVPNVGYQHSLTSNVMVVNKDGDLEMHAIHDTPKQIAWSARGDLALGAGLGLRVLPGSGEGENDDEENGFSSEQLRRKSRDTNSRGRDTSRDGTRERSRESTSPSTSRQAASINRGRARQSASNRETYTGKDEAGLVTPRPTTSFSKASQSSSKRPKSPKQSPSKPRKHSPVVERDERRAQKKSSSSRADLHSVLNSRDLSRDDRTRTTSHSKDTREGGNKLQEATIISLIKEDISMVILRRVKAGYGLSQLQYNLVVTQDREPSDGTTALSEFWAWLFHSLEIFCIPTARLHGYDFAYQGLLGIWDGLASPPIIGEEPLTSPSLHLDPVLPTTSPLYPTFSLNVTGNGGNGTTKRSKHRSRSPADGLHGNWSAALATIAARRGDTPRSAWRPAVHTSKLLQRQVALQVIGWSLREDELNDAIGRWEREGQFARAACWLVFTKQYGKAADLLMKSEDETHQMMSGTIAALAPVISATGSARGLERELYGRLVSKLNDPYFRMLLTHLSINEWSEVLDDDFIPFRERLAIALQFLDDKALTSYLWRLTESACEHGSIDGLILTGLTPTGMRVIQSYVDHTGDVQSAAILSSYVCPHRFKDKRAERWLESYRDLLDGFKLHHLRVGFDIERGQILQEAVQAGSDIDDWAPKQVLIRCYYCNKSVEDAGLLTDQPQSHKGRPTQCSNCNRELPRCAVCLMTLSVMSDAAREATLGFSRNRDTIDDAIVICQTCRHGGHANHILEWFLGEDGCRTRSVCPVADCNCRCAEEC